MSHHNKCTHYQKLSFTPLLPFLTIAVLKSTVHKSVDQSSLSTLVAPNTTLSANETTVSSPPAVHGGDDPVQTGTSQEILIIATILPTMFVSVSFFILGTA